MSVVSCVRMPGSRRGPIRDQKGGWSYHETYIVRTNSVDDDGQVVEKASELPTLNSGYPNDAAAIVTLISPQQSSEHDMVWEVEVTWTYGGPGGGGGGGGGNAMELPPTRSWTSTPYQVFPLKDRKGKPYKNAAGDPFDPPPIRLQFNQILTVRMNRLSYDAAEADNYLNAINSDAITVDNKTFPKFSGKIIHYGGDMDFLSSGVPYWRIVIAIEFNQDLWFPTEVINKGYRYFAVGQEASGPVTAKDGSGVSYGREVFLDPQGYKLPETDPNIWWSLFDDYRQLSFATLNLPLG